MAIEYTAIMPKSQYDIMHNTKIKTYPDGSQKITVATRPIFREKGWEQSNTPHVHVKVPRHQDPNSETRSDSLRRSVGKIYDIIAMNLDKFQYFVTLTFDPAKVDSKSTKEVISIMRQFLKNMSNRHGLAYILIPEYHKSGMIHLHGLISNTLQLIDSGTRKARGYDKPMRIATIKRKGIALNECKMVYNLPQWKYGHSTAMEISGNGKMVFSYITKYITKDMEKIFGNFYYAGGEINRDAPVELTDMDYSSFECDNEVYCEPARTGFKYRYIEN